MSFLAISWHDKIVTSPADHRQHGQLAASAAHLPAALYWKVTCLGNYLFPHGSKYAFNVAAFGVIEA